MTYKGGEGDGTPLQCSCLENPMEGRAWWAAVHGVVELDTTEWLHFSFSLSCIGEGNGNPFQCSYLENPRDRGAWWTAVYGVTQSRTRLKWLSSSSSGRVGRRKGRKGFLDFKLNQQDIQLPLVSLRCKTDSVSQSTWDQPLFPVA